MDQDVQHPQAHPVVSAAAARKKKPPKPLPPIVYEIGAALTVGWLVWVGTGDWKQGVGAALVSMFGGGAHRAGRWYADRHRED